MQSFLEPFASVTVLKYSRVSLSQPTPHKSRSMNNRPFLVFVIFVFACATHLTARGQTTVLDRIVAVVGNECILLSDLNAQTEFYAFNNRVEPSTPEIGRASCR